MNLFKRLFGSNLTKSKKSPNEFMVNLSSVAKNQTTTNETIVEESQIPAYCSIGNLVYEKKYHEAIELGEMLLAANPESSGVHVNLMDAFFKIRDEKPIYYEKHIKHARLAMLYGHNTGYVQKNLAIALEKQRMISQAIQICDIVLDEKFHFSKFGCGHKNEFISRKFKLLKKVNTSLDNNESMVFTNDEISLVSH
jgi:tetratricopeptide (TPR) repeat protein